MSIELITETKIVGIVKHLIKGIVKYPQDVTVDLDVNNSNSSKLIEVQINSADRGVVIGHRGKTINALRDVVSALGGKSYRINILDEP